MKEYYLDNASTTKPREEVIQAMLPYLTEKWYNPSSKYNSSIGVRKDIENVRHTIANYIDCNADENGDSRYGMSVYTERVKNGASAIGTGANGSPIPGNNPGADNSIVGRNGTDEGLFGTNGTSYEQMVRNGLVHDTDGDLTDGENSHS